MTSLLLRALRRWPRIHRLWHRPGSWDPCLICALVWDACMADPAFVAGLKAGEAELAAGRVRPWADIKAELDARKVQ